MSHWAEINESNIVLRVLVGNNNDVNEGYDWLIENLGGTWVKTSYNAATNGFRKNYAGLGYTYDEVRDAFIPPKPFESWILNEDTCQWTAPVDYPVDDKNYMWDEPTVSWKEIVAEESGE
jgi:hypothetical protein